MDYRYLKAFILTAENKSFSKAAEELKIAQSAVSRQIKLLEESVGEELIIRSSKKVLLTHKGKELFIAATSFDQVSSNIFEKEDNRPLKIGILNGLLKTWFNPVLVKFYKKYDRNMNIHIADIPELRKGMEEGRFDAIFSIENIQSELISSLKLFDEKLVLISKSEVDLQKLHEYRWITFSEGDNLFSVTKKKSERITNVDSISTIINLVKNNVGIAVVPDHVLKKTDNLVITEMPELPKSEIYLTTLNYKTMPKQIRELLQVMPGP